MPALPSLTSSPRPANGGAALKHHNAVSPEILPRSTRHDAPPFAHVRRPRLFTFRLRRLLSRAERRAPEADADARRGGARLYGGGARPRLRLRREGAVR